MKTDILLIGLGALLLMRTKSASNQGADTNTVVENPILPNQTWTPNSTEEVKLRIKGYTDYTKTDQGVSIWSPIPAISGYSEQFTQNGTTYTNTVLQDLSVVHTATASAENMVASISAANPGLSPAQINNLASSYGITTGRVY